MMRNSGGFGRGYYPSMFGSFKQEDINKLILNSKQNEINKKSQEIVWEDGEFLQLANWVGIISKEEFEKVLEVQTKQKMEYIFKGATLIQNSREILIEIQDNPIKKMCMSDLIEVITDLQKDQDFPNAFLKMNEINKKYEEIKNNQINGGISK